MNWQLQEAKSKFSQVVNQALKDGPQIVTRHGKAVVVILSMDQYQKMAEPQPSLLKLLLDSPLPDSGLQLIRNNEDADYILPVDTDINQSDFVDTGLMLINPWE